MTMNNPRVRFSIKSMMLLIVIVGLALVVVMQWRELVPLRAELRQRRAELGYLTIDDDTRPQAIQVNVPDRNIWRWRIYLPPGGRYGLAKYTGVLPARLGKSKDQWLKEIANAENTSDSSKFSSSITRNEFTLNATLKQEQGNWLFETDPGGLLSVSKFQNDWPADSARILYSDALVDRQREFKPGETIVLLYLPKPKLTPSPGGGQHYEEPTEPAEAILLLLEHQPGP